MQCKEVWEDLTALCWILYMYVKVRRRSFACCHSFILLVHTSSSTSGLRSAPRKWTAFDHLPQACYISLHFPSPSYFRLISFWETVTGDNPLWCMQSLSKGFRAANYSSHFLSITFLTLEHSNKTVHVTQTPRRIAENFLTERVFILRVFKSFCQVKLIYCNCSIVVLDVQKPHKRLPIGDQTVSSLRQRKLKDLYPDKENESISLSFICIHLKQFPFTYCP